MKSENRKSAAEQTRISDDRELRGARVYSRSRSNSTRGRIGSNVSNSPLSRKSSEKLNIAQHNMFRNTFTNKNKFEDAGQVKHRLSLESLNSSTLSKKESKEIIRPKIPLATTNLG